MTGLFDRALDRVLDVAVAPGYSRLGYLLRHRHWPADDPAPGAMAGRTALVTGASSGLGQRTALELARLGASVQLLVRDRGRGERAADVIRSAVPGAELAVVTCDVADLSEVRRTAADLTARLDRLDVVVHNAGAMPAQRTDSADGHELTMALHVLGPVLMTELLRPVLAGHGARVVLVSSGGMYTQRLPAHDPDYREGGYRRAVAYARSKRTQVALTAALQHRWSDDDIDVHVMHPGWADTPGVASSLPLFRTLARPLLRDAALGADTVVWLAATRPAPPGGRFWHDRAARPTHYLGTRRETAVERERMWTWVRGASGLRD